MPGSLCCRGSPGCRPPIWRRSKGVRLRVCAAAGSVPRPPSPPLSDASRDSVVSSIYDCGVRRFRRRCPAGQPRVPIIVGKSVLAAAVVSPAVVRIGPDRSLLEPPWDMLGCTVAHIWLDDHASGGLAGAVWPRDPWSNRPIAPLDLHLGHVLELAVEREAYR